MHPADLPALLASRGIRLGYRLTLDAPKGAVDPELRCQLEQFKPVLVEALARAELAGIGADRFADLLTLDRQGFDWAAGQQEEVTS
jgi:hypothetical protein